MSNCRSYEERFQAYLQADAPARAGQFPEFVKALGEVAAEQGAAAASPWAGRAVGPQLDYSSLMKLRKFLPPSRDAQPAPAPRRIAVLGGPTTIQLRQLIEVFLAAERLPVEIYESEYGLFRQEILTPGSALDQFAPQVVFVATSVRDVSRLPDLNEDDPSVARMAEEEIAAWDQLWRTANTRWNATLLQNNFETPPGDVLGHYGVRHPAARKNYVHRLNGLMAQQAPAYVVLHDLHDLAAEAGAHRWFDPRFYFEFKMPCGAECLVSYAHSVVSLLRGVLGRSKKVVVVDLDNTLWGGVVGDVGPGGIKLGQGSGEGEAFLAFQRYLKELQQRGVVLAVCSKNNDQQAREPFQQRDEMVLKLSDFSCFVANYNTKADNLRRIAERLDLKLDSFVFVDDNPAERAIVRRYVPEVAVPDLPEDPAGYIRALAEQRYFETASLTREDAARTRYYSENAQRRELAAQAADLDSFLESLGMRMTVSPIDDMNVERAAQLLNKSNQFNLTTRRYTLAEVRQMAGSPQWRTLTFRLRDTLGDNGLISVILVRPEGDSLNVDTWVMSCRVLQRGVEQCARNELVALARREGCRRILGTYIPTAKNALVKDHYAKLGFTPAGADGETTFWSLEVGGEISPLTHHIQYEHSHGEVAHE